MKEWATVAKWQHILLTLYWDGERATLFLVEGQEGGVRAGQYAMWPHNAKAGFVRPVYCSNSERASNATTHCATKVARVDTARHLEENAATGQRHHGGGEK